MIQPKDVYIVTNNAKANHTFVVESNHLSNSVLSSKCLEFKFRNKVKSDLKPKLSMELEERFQVRDWLFQRKRKREHI